MQIKRACWKFPFNRIQCSFYKKTIDNTISKVYNRNLTLTTPMLNKIVKCHKGKVIGKLLIEKHHLGHKLGEFFTTKILGERIFYRKKQKLLLKKHKNKQKKIKK